MLLHAPDGLSQELVQSAAPGPTQEQSIPQEEMQQDATNVSSLQQVPDDAHLIITSRLQQELHASRDEVSTPSSFLYTCFMQHRATCTENVTIFCWVMSAQSPLIHSCPQTLGGLLSSCCTVWLLSAHHDSLPALHSWPSASSLGALIQSLLATYPASMVGGVCSHVLACCF